jgi:hypothetical protein
LERARARTPLKACLRLSTLMFDSFIKLNDELNASVWGISKTINTSSHSARNAKVIPIQTKCKQLH